MNQHIYPSKKEWLSHYNVQRKTFAYRIKHGYTIDQALGIEPLIHSCNKPVCFRKVYYKSHAVLATTFGLSKHLLYQRLKKGWSYEEALGLVPPPSIGSPSMSYCVYVYKNTGKNEDFGKCYVGITNDNENRLNEHILNSVKESNQHSIDYAINLYGIEAFSCEILYDNLSQSEARYLEIEAAAEFNSYFPHGYNLRLGGSVGKSRAKHYLLKVDGKYQNLNMRQISSLPNQPSIHVLLKRRQAGIIGERLFCNKDLRCRAVTVEGIKFRSIKSACDHFKAPYSRTKERLRQKWSITDAILLPKGSSPSKIS